MVRRGKRDKSSALGDKASHSAALPSPAVGKSRARASQATPAPSAPAKPVTAAPPSAGDENVPHNSAAVSATPSGKVNLATEALGSAAASAAASSALPAPSLAASLSSPSTRSSPRAAAAAAAAAAGASAPSCSSPPKKKVAAATPKTSTRASLRSGEKPPAGSGAAFGAAVVAATPAAPAPVSQAGSATAANLAAAAATLAGPASATSTSSSAAPPPPHTRTSLESAADALMSLPSSPAPRTPHLHKPPQPRSSHRTPTALFNSALSPSHLDGLAFSPFGMSGGDDLLGSATPGHVPANGGVNVKGARGPVGKPTNPTAAAAAASAATVGNPFSPFAKFITNLSPLPSNTAIHDCTSLQSSPVQPYALASPAPGASAHAAGMIDRGVLSGFGLDAAIEQGGWSGDGQGKGPLKKRGGRGQQEQIQRRARDSPSWISVQLGTFESTSAFGAISEGLKLGVEARNIVDPDLISGASKKKAAPRRKQDANGARVGPPPHSIMAAGMHPGIDAPHPRENENIGEKKKIVCNCKKSKCLKLYCECFTALEYCDGCNCNECRNLPEWDTMRSEAIKATKAKNANAFKQKIGGAKQVANGTHQMGCRCKKSFCLKKYCECYEAGVFCGEKCRCVSCANFVGSAKLVERRKKIKDYKGAQMAVVAAEDQWKHQNAAFAQHIGGVTQVRRAPLSRAS
ncbi:hypothetical protein TeGR_g6252 [Tetraparma gracilis]|uniref:CRC domain-containing protein n=1 Tax=Tetraparma gracilis TaxID=2962635 RepID=A0ABQ6N8B7_9STRA|nr:hypothetical protein TeGR_g6252 [Tetraparma gracilis]